MGRSRSGSALEGTPRPPRSRLARGTSQLSGVVMEAAPSLKQLTGGRSPIQRQGGVIAAASRFNSAMVKTLQIDDLSSGKRKRLRNRLSKTQSKLAAATTLGNIVHSPRPVRKDGLTPLQRFRKAARLVKLLVTISNVCRDLLVYAIKDEQWYEFCEKFLKDANAGGTPLDKNSFLTTIKNPVTKQYEQIEFDAAQFKHDYHSGTSLLTDDIKTMLSKRPGTRTQRELEECIYCIKRLVPAFRSYTYEQQKLICQAVMYDRYFQERVILRENLPPDGIYFVLNGTLMESGQKMSAPRVIKPGDKFGEEDLKSGMTRQNNVVTKSSVDLLYLHKFDYEEIFELCVDLSGDELSVFDICKNELVFNYYPIGELVRNPARWQVLKFKYGRLIAANSCETEFIYVIRSGEARVFKALQTRTINVAQRRRRLQNELDSANPYVNRQKLLDFVSDTKFHVARYKLNAYGAKNLAADSKPIAERVKSFSKASKHQKEGKPRDFLSPRPKTALAELAARRGAADSVNADKQAIEIVEENEPTEPAAGEPKHSHFPRINRAQTAGQLQVNSNPQSMRPRRVQTTKTTISSQSTEEYDMYRQRKAAVNKVVPPFVQVGSLQAGQTYGMRSLLPVDQQGEPAALVSAGCEVIQINRKFFAKYLDENMTNIIALKAKAYPSEDELLKRLDVNLQWEEYCAIVMCGYLDSKVVSFRGSHIVLPK